ncbi:MAG: C45 family peptidase [Actinomycetes bacterium]
MTHVSPSSLAPAAVEMDIAFHAIDGGSQVEARLPGTFHYAWPAYRSWFLRDGESARASYADSIRQLRTHMPELMGTYERLVDAVGGGDLEARFLSHWSPPPLFAACSMAAWTRDANLLVRNYDFPPALCDATVIASSWNGTRVLAMSDCVWGALDGMNEHGLAVAISFGGRKVVGPGFGIGLVVRYLLEFARDVPEALETLGRLPMSMAYNVALVDSSGGAAVAYVSPDRPMVVGPWTTAANRQGATEWPEHAEFCSTVERELALAETVAHPNTTPAGLVQAFLRPPLYRPTAESTWGTVYTSVYDADQRTMTLAWPDARWTIAMDAFVPDTVVRRTMVALPPREHAPMPVAAQERPLLIA